jgi:mono/diheme cytochrome c family protein
MPLVWQEKSLQMEWCLECHRQPEKYVRPLAEVYNAAYEPPADQLALGRQLVRDYAIKPRTSCSTCHR